MSDRISLRLNLALLGMCLGSFHICSADEPNEQQVVSTRENELSATNRHKRTPEELHAWQRSLDFGRQWLSDRSPVEFVAIDPSEFSWVLKISVFPVSSSIFTAEVAPLDPGKFPPELREGVDVRMSAYAATANTDNDLLECRWTHEGRSLRVVTSINAIKVDFDLSQMRECGWTTGAACVFAAKRWVESVLKLKGVYPGVDGTIEYETKLPWPHALSDGTWYSSAPEINIAQLRGMPYFFDRVDAYVEDGVLSILVYKKIGQLMSYRDGSKWFPDDFRAWIHEQARLQGRLPEPDDPE